MSRTIHESRRQFFKQLGAGVATVGGMSFLGRVAQAATGFPITGVGGRDAIDRVSATSAAAFLRDTGNGFYTIKAMGIPNHATGIFPNENCPESILAQNSTFRMTSKPQAVSKPIALEGWLFGVCLNGVVLDPSGPFWRGDAKTGWLFEVNSTTARQYLGLDQNNAHCQAGGEYHYHGLPVGLLNRILDDRQARGAQNGMILLGFAADGFPIYAPIGHSNAIDSTSSLKTLRSSYVLKSGARPSTGPQGNHDGSFCMDYEYRAGSGDLDECNGRFGVTAEYPKGTYYYVLTYDYPFIPRFWKGKPDKSFAHGPGLAGGGAIPEVPAPMQTSAPVPKELLKLFP